MTLRRPQLAGVHEPAGPRIAGQFVTRQDADQAMGRIRDGGLTAKPVTHGALGDVKNFPDIVGLQASLQAQDFKALPSIGAGLRSVGCLFLRLSVCSTMFIMLINMFST